jgi:hypothetical protein
MAKVTPSDVAAVVAPANADVLIDIERKRWMEETEKVTVYPDGSSRKWRHGERTGQMEHAAKRAALSGDHSVDQVWEVSFIVGFITNACVRIKWNPERTLADRVAVASRAAVPTLTDTQYPLQTDPTLAFNDSYVNITAYIHIVIKTLMFGLPLFIAVSPLRSFFFPLASLISPLKFFPRTSSVRCRTTCTSFFFFHLKRNRSINISLFLQTMRAMLRCTCQAMPVTALAKWYSVGQSIPTDRVVRDCKFWSMAIAAFLFGFPYLALCTASYIVDVLFYGLYNLPWAIRHPMRYHTNRKVIEPYRNGPSVLWYLSDTLVALIGQTNRQGWFESSARLTWTPIAIPFIKYFVNANPWIYPLEERMFQQISTTMRDMPLDGEKGVTAAARRIISRSKQTDENANRMDMWEFAPHYPYPPPGRDFALGQQAGGTLVPLLLTVHVTHALKEPVPEGSTELRDSEYWKYSNSMELPIWRVMLWYNNPYHMFTGFVEASISAGGAQDDKYLGGEHPMWMVTSRSPMASNTGKDSQWFGFIDRFFDQWLPTFVDEVRRQNRGPAIALQMHQEVISKDGISRPAAKIGVKLNATEYKDGEGDAKDLGRDALVELQNAAKAEEEEPANETKPVSEVNPVIDSKADEG